MFLTVFFIREESGVCIIGFFPVESKPKRLFSKWQFLVECWVCYHSQFLPSNCAGVSCLARKDFFFEIFLLYSFV